MLFVSPGHPVRVEVFIGVGFAEDLHPQNSEDVDHDDEEEGEVAQGPQGADDDTQQDLHRRPGLGQLQDTHLGRGERERGRVNLEAEFCILMSLAKEIEGAVA